MVEIAEIPSIRAGIDKSRLKIIISENYLDFAPEYMSFLGEWITGTYKAFNDADKYIILAYLFNKTVTFYHDNFVRVTYDQFYNEHIYVFSTIALENILKKHNLEIFKINKLNVHGGSNRYFIKKKIMI